MSVQHSTSPSTEGTPAAEDLNDLLQELRVLLPGTQVLAAFLVILPFNQGFRKLAQTEQWIYVATFTCAIVSLICFMAPAAQHRLERPLGNRERFKRDATRLMIVGSLPLSGAWVLTSHLVVDEVVGQPARPRYGVCPDRRPLVGVPLSAAAHASVPCVILPAT